MYLKGCIGTVINSDKNKSNNNGKIDIEDFKESNYKKAYIMKEFTIIKRSPIFLIQCIITPVIMILGIISVVIGLLVVSRFFDLSVLRTVTDKTWFVGVVLAICQALYMMNFSSIIAVSKEKRWAILSKYIPLKLSRQIQLKLTIGKIINLVASLSVIII